MRSLNIKIVLVMLLLLTLYAAGLYVYNRLFTINRMIEEVTGFKNYYTEQGNLYKRQIEELYPDLEQIKVLLTQVTQDQITSVELIDVMGNDIFQADHTVPGVWKWKFEVSEFAIKDGKAVLLVKFKYSLLLMDILIKMSVLGNLMYVTIYFIAVAMVLLLIYLHYTITKPLQLLHLAITKVSFHNMRFASKYFKRKDEIGDIFRNFDEMGSRLESSQKEQVEMIAAISHDIKTPLTSILGYAQRLSEGKIHSEEKRKEYYETIYRKARDIQVLTDDFTSFSNNEYDSRNLQRTRLPVRAFFENIFLEYSEELEVYSAKVLHYCSLSDDVQFEIDVIQIRRVFANVISNVVTYVNAPLRMRMDCKYVNDQVCFSIEDNGQGVPQEELEAIFRKFYRTEKSRSREKGGSGLGLSICQSIVEAHGGMITAYRSPEGGLGIEFTLPLYKL